LRLKGFTPAVLTKNPDNMVASFLAFFLASKRMIVMPNLCSPGMKPPKYNMRWALSLGIILVDVSPSSMEKDSVSGDMEHMQSSSKC